MSRSERLANIAFGFTVVAVGYTFLPVETPEWLNWFASISLLIMGVIILVRVKAK